MILSGEKIFERLEGKMIDHGRKKIPHEVTEDVLSLFEEAELEIVRRIASAAEDVGKLDKEIKLIETELKALIQERERRMVQVSGRGRQSRKANKVIDDDVIEKIVNEIKELKFKLRCVKHDHGIEKGK